MPSQLQEPRLLDPQIRDELAAGLLARAREQGFVLRRDILGLLSRDGLPAQASREILAACRPQLRYRQGRYYPVSPMVLRLHQAREKQRAIQRAVRHLVRRQRQAQALYVDRRQHTRRPFFQQIILHTADGRHLRLCSSDVSISGIRLIGAYNLQGMRVRLEIPPTEGEGNSVFFALHILWAKLVADNLFENGGVFEEVEA